VFWKGIHFSSEAVTVIHHNPLHAICNGHTIHSLRLGNVRNTQYLLIPNTKQNNFVTNICWRFCVSGNIKKLWSVTALYIFDVWAARCYWQLLFHLVSVGMKNFQLLLCLTSKRYDLLSFADGIDSFLLRAPKNNNTLNFIPQRTSKSLHPLPSPLLFLTENNTATWWLPLLTHHMFMFVLYIYIYIHT